MTTKTLIVREPEERDIPQIAGLMNQLGYPVADMFAGEQMRLLAEGGADWMFVAAAGEALVGLICYHQFRFHHMPGLFGRITVLVVEEHHRREGVGRKLMDFLEAFAREQGCVRLELNSAAHRVDAHTFYGDLGYTEDAKRFVKKLID